MINNNANIYPFTLSWRIPNRTEARMLFRIFCLLKSSTSTYCAPPFFECKFYCVTCVDCCFPASLLLLLFFSCESSTYERRVRACTRGTSSHCHVMIMIILYAGLVDFLWSIKSITIKIYNIKAPFFYYRHDNKCCSTDPGIISSSGNSQSSPLRSRPASCYILFT